MVLFDGFDLLDAVGPYEVLTAAGLFAPSSVTAELVSAEGARAVPSSPAGVTLHAVGPIDPSADVIVVPGAAGRVTGDGEATVPSLLAATLVTDLPTQLGRALRSPGTTVATVCGGSLILAMAGLAEGRPLTTHHLGADLLEASGALLVPARIVDDGDLVSAGGVTSGLDLGIYLVERFLGPQLAHSVESLFEYERRGTVWRSQGLVPEAL